MRKLFKTRLHRRNFTKGIYSWAVSLVRYSGPFVKWSRVLQQMDQNTKTSDNA